MLTVRAAIPSPHALAVAEFTTLRMRLLKIAGRITETATRVRIAFAPACPEAELFRYRPQPPARRIVTCGVLPPNSPSRHPQRPSRVSMYDFGATDDV
jgi:hypothetical protein